MTNTKKLDLEREDVQKLITILATYSYGMATFTVDENMNPKEIRLDGSTYDVHNKEHITTLVNHFIKIEEAVQKVEKQYNSMKDLPKHIDTDVYLYHPRWISARKQYNMIPQVEGEIECSFKYVNREKTCHQWNQCLWLATGSPEPICDIPLNQKMSAKEYEERLDEITFSSDYDYFQGYINAFINMYNGPADLTKLKETANLLLSYKKYSPELHTLSDFIREEMQKIDLATERKACHKTSEGFYHPDLNAFVNTHYFCQIYSKFGVVMTFDEQKFPLLVKNGKTFDFRNPNALNMLINNITKSSRNRSSQPNNNKTTVKSKNKKKKK